MTKAEVLLTRPSDIESVYPIRPKGAVGFRGVGFRRSNGHDYYFKTSKSDEILSVLRACGIPVSGAGSTGHQSVASNSLNHDPSPAANWAR